MSELDQTVVESANTGNSSRRTIIVWIGLTFGLFGALLLMFVVWATLRFGSVGGGFAYIAGDPLVVDHDVIDFSHVKEGGDYERDFSIRNLTSANIRLVGAQSSCSCAVVDGIPTIIGPGEVSTARIHLHPRKTSVLLSESITIFTDNPDIRTLRIKVTGAVGSQ